VTSNSLSRESGRKPGRLALVGIGVEPADRGWFVTPPFSEPEVFDFPGGIGPVECVNVEHEEVLLMPRWIKAKRVTFKYGLGTEFIDVLKTLNKLRLDQTKPVNVKGAQVSPRDVVAACLPDPAFLGDAMHGKTCAGLWVTGPGKDSKPREVYLYHVVDNQDTMREYEAQCVVWQTAVNPVVALELLAAGAWSGAGVLGPEAFDAVPLLDLLAGDYASPWGLWESWRMSGGSRRTVQLSRVGRHHFQATNSRGGTLSFGSTQSGEFTPVELLLVAIAGCTAMDVDAITVKRSEPARFDVTCSGHYTRSVHGNHITDIQVDFDVEFPDSEGGRAAADVLEIAIRKSHDRLCTVTRTVELATPVGARLQGESVLQAGSPM
jgi:uncharacterized OsmC-like protein